MKEAPPIKLYLAHPFDSREYVRAWELKFEQKFPMIQLVNPFYDGGRKDVVGIDEGRHGRYEKLVPEELVTRDLGTIKNADGTLAIVDGALSYGTIMEIVYSMLFNKPVYIVVSNNHDKHPWLVFHSSKIVRSLGEFEQYAKAELIDFIHDQKREESNE